MSVFNCKKNKCLKHRIGEYNCTFMGARCRCFKTVYWLEFLSVIICNSIMTGVALDAPHFPHPVQNAGVDLPSPLWFRTLLSNGPSLSTDFWQAFEIWEEGLSPSCFTNWISAGGRLRGVPALAAPSLECPPSRGLPCCTTELLWGTHKNLFVQASLSYRASGCLNWF